MSTAPKRLRCAVYTRKSSEEGLELEYTSIDAQRDSGAAYIASRRAEGWIPVAHDYDDGGFSGGTLDRPALRRLLADIEAGQVDIIIAYKIDRLSRSLYDFAELVKVFDRHGVTFQAYSPLERGVLTGKITSPEQVTMGRARSSLAWFKPENLPKIADLRVKWAPLCAKYGCSMTQLVIGWTAAQGNGHNVNVLCGARKLHQIEDNAGGGDVVLDTADMAAMRRDVEALG